MILTWYISDFIFLAAAGARNVQPDLLCGQNRFPQHLDNPPTADVAISAEASSVPGADRQVNGAGFDPDLEFNDEDDDQVCMNFLSLYLTIQTSNVPDKEAF